MKLLNFQTGAFSYFGVAVSNYAASFEWLQQKTNQAYPDLDCMESYLEGLPQSLQNASALHQVASDLIRQNKTSGMNLLSDIKILPPVPRPT